MSKNTTIARPYAKAAFATALQDKTISDWSNFLNTAKLVISNPQIITLLKNPKITNEQRFDCLADICKQTMHEPQSNFLRLLSSQHRLLILPEIAELFETLRIEHEKRINVEVISATALSAAEKERLAQALKIRLQRDVSLEYHIDKSLIGGNIIRADNLVIDDSIRGKLVRLQTAIVD